MQPPLFKIRCSQISKIMGGTAGLTAIQVGELARLKAKDKRTANQDAEMIRLQAIHDAPAALSQGARTYIQQWVKEQAAFYNRRAEFTSKYTERGNLSEAEAIRLIIRMQGYSPLLEKNEQRFEDDELTGTPDLLTRDWVDDAKCSWDWQTFPLFATSLPERAYHDQQQGYMALTGRKRGRVNYCLIDTPYELVEYEAKKAAYRAGFNELPSEIFDAVESAMTYGDIPDRMRYKAFEIERNDSFIDDVRQQVHRCRAYVSELWERFYSSGTFSPALSASAGPAGSVLVEPVKLQP